MSANTLRQIELASYLFLHQTTVAEKQLLQDLNMTKFSLRETSSRLSQKLKQHPELRLQLKTSATKRSVSYQLLNPTSINSKYLYVIYLNETIQYQILIYLFDKDSYNVPHLATLLNISESTLFRQTSILNRKLAEFDLQIKNGHLYGTELQKINFYYELIWNSAPLTDSQRYREETSIKQIIQELAKNLETTFDESTSLKLATWLKICRIRIKVDPIEKDNQYCSLLETAFKDPLFRLVLNAFNTATIYDTYSKDNRPSLYLYLFIVSLFAQNDHNQMILNHDASWQNPFTLINQHVDWIFEETFSQLQLTDLSINNALKLTWRPTLTQLFNQHYLFKGHAVFSYDDYKLNETPQNITANALVERLINNSLKTIDQTDQYDYLKQSYNHFFTEFLNDALKYTEHKIQLGIYTKQGFCYNRFLEKKFANNLSLAHNCAIETAQASKQYDILITDTVYFLKIFEFKHYYILNDSLSATDFENLGTILHELSVQQINHSQIS